MPENNNSTSERSLERFGRLLILLSRPKIAFVVDKAKFESLDSKLRAYATSATESLLDELSFVFSSDTPLYLFTSDARFYAGARKLKSHLNRQGDFINVQVAPPVLLKKISNMAITMVVDFSFPTQFEVRPEEMEELAKASLVGRLAMLDEIQILQHGRQAMPMELDGKQYAVGFLHPRDAASTIKKLEDGGRGYRSSPNKPFNLAKDLLNSPLDGVIINPGGEEQAVVSREHLEYLCYAVDILRGRGLNRILRQVFPSRYGVSM